MMMMKSLFSKCILIGLAAIVFPTLIFLSVKSYDSLLNKLPEKIKVESESEALLHIKGRNFVRVLGTGSMAPYISRAIAGEDPMKTVVAIAVFHPKKNYKDIKVGDLVNYRIPQVKQFSSILHQAVEKDSDGWIMSGIGNSYSENLLRLTEENFIGIVEEVYVWPPYDK